MDKGKQQQHPNTIKGRPAAPRSPSCSSTARSQLCRFHPTRGLEVRPGAARPQDFHSLWGFPVGPCGPHKQRLLCLLSSDTSKPGDSKARGPPSAPTPAGCAPAASRPQFPQTSSSR